MRRTPFLIPILLLCPVLAFGQSPPAGSAPPPAPVESAPLPPPSSSPAPAASPESQNSPATQPAPVTPASPPAAAAPAQPSTPPSAAQEPSPAPAAPSQPPVATARTTLVPGPGDPSNAEEVMLPGKAAAVLSGTSTWDEGFSSLKNAFRKIEEELTRAGMSPTGRPLAIFLQTDDLGFRYDAMVPVAPGLESHAPLSPEVHFGKTPSGKALRFVHKDAYDEIDETYETITAYLDAKNITAKDMFIEEYVTDLTDSTDTNLEINIFVQPKE